MSRTRRILVVDHEWNARNSLADQLRDEGYAVETATDSLEALHQHAAFGAEVVLTDLVADIDGPTLVEKLRALDDPPTVIVTTTSGIETAIAGLRAGAALQLAKPVHFDELVVVLDKVYETRERCRELVQLRERVRDRFAPENLVGASPAMQRLFAIIDQVASSRAPVLISGESGTGKELVANAIHQRSTRATAPFLKLHCAALSETLLESELFGHERGSFNGATLRKDGRAVLADGGTLFLDEVHEIAPATQVKLVHFFQEHEVERFGGGPPISLDVRVIAATDKSLADEVKQGHFREDLFYRLDVVSIQIPPLRERRPDIPVLAKLFLDRFVKESGKAIETFSPEALEVLTAYDWPGNVRELENAIERAVILTPATCAAIEPRQLPPNVRPRLTPSGVPIIPGATMNDLERYAILETLKATNGSTSKAAEILGISTRTIQYRVHQYNEAREASPRTNARERAQRST